MKKAFWYVLITFITIVIISLVVIIDKKVAAPTENKVDEKTEKLKLLNNVDKKIDYFITQVNRKEKLFLIKMIVNLIKSIYIYIKEQPDVIISLGVLSTIPMMYLGHFFNKRLIYIESFAKISSPTKTGELVYKKKLADRFYVQWEPMLKVYPKAIYKGGIY